MVLSPRSRLTGGRPVDGLFYKLFFTYLLFLSLSFLVNRFWVSSSRRCSKFLRTIILEISFITGLWNSSSFFKVYFVIIFFLASLSKWSSWSCRYRLELIMLWSDSLLMIFGWKVHSFNYYSSLLNKYYFIFEAWRSLPDLFIILDSSNSLNLLAIRFDRWLIYGLNLHSLISFCFFS
jgi:hypothetical protein